MNEQYMCENGWSVKAILLFVLTIGSLLTGFSVSAYSDTTTLPTTITITFEDGASSGNLPIADNYSPLGVVFNNAIWITPAQTLSQPHNNYFRGNAGFGVQNGVQTSYSWAFPGNTSPIEVIFSRAVGSVSIEVFDVGSNGARLRAFGSNGNQIGTDQTVAGKGAGTGNGPFTLSVRGGNINSIKLDQYLYNGADDGIGWDNLTFTFDNTVIAVAPEPSTILLFIAVLPIAAFILRRRRV